MADSTASDREIANNNHTVDIENTDAVALAMVNTKSRDVLTPEDAASKTTKEEYIGRWQRAGEKESACTTDIGPS